MGHVRAIGRALLRRPTTPGVVVGLVFWWFSLVPLEDAARVGRQSMAVRHRGRNNVAGTPGVEELS
jgi:hypothetical protein